MADLVLEVELAGTEGREVDELDVAFAGVEDLDLAAVGLEEGIEVLELGAEELEGFGFAGKDGRLVGVADLETGFRFPDDDEGLLLVGSTLVDLAGSDELLLTVEDLPHAGCCSKEYRIRTN